MAANSQNHDDPEGGSVNGQESTTKDKKPKGWKHISKKPGSKMSDALRRIYETQNQLHKFNYTGKKIKHFEIIVI